MKIGFIEPHLGCVGGIRRIIEISNRLVDRGHGVTIFDPTGRKTTWLPIKASVAKLTKVPTYELDVAIYNLADQYKIANAANTRCRVFWVLAAEAAYKHPKIPIEALNQGHFMIANSTFTANYIKTNCAKLRHPVPIVPGGINPDHFKYDPTIPTEYHVLYYGSARPWKGTAIIEHALLGTNLKTLKMEGLNTPQTSMYKLYNASEIFISAGQVEGFNFPILEAMACGAVVVCTDDGGNRDFVKHQQNAIVVPRHATAIRTAVTTLIDDKPLRRRLRKNGLRTATANKYNWDVVTRKFEAVLLKRLSEC